MLDNSSPKLVLEGGTKLERVLVQGRALSIGQASGVGFKLPHPSVAPVHCDVIWEGDLILLRSRDPEYPQIVNGRVVVGDATLRDGDRFSVGLFFIRLDWKQDALPADAGDESTRSASDSSTPGSHGLSAQTIDPLVADSGLQVIYGNRPVEEVPLRSQLRIGSGSEAEVRLEGPEISSVHLEISATEDGWLLTDKGQAGSLLNGRFFDSQVLTIGDFVSLGGYCFRYDGHSLLRVAGTAGCGIRAVGLAIEFRGHCILKDASFDARPGQFVGILGPSGAGKTTLLKALSGLYSTTQGEVWIDNQPIGQIDDLSRYLGFVPQQEIVHLDLTARQALMFSAKLRLPRRTPVSEIRRLTAHLAERLGLSEHLDKRAANLSGGQLKRLSVCVELLNRPALLFLDEPTSGLDPESETELMRHLQELPHTGCTVVATTHLMENVYLMNRIEVVMAGVDENTQEAQPGTTIFRGRPREAKEFFQVRSLSKLYGKLADRSRDEWRRMFYQQADPVAPPEQESAADGHRRRRLRKRFALPILVRRHLALLASDVKNVLLLVLQPLFIGLLIGIVAVDEHSSGTQLFLCYIATLWLGCSNSATELVRERSIFLRERFVGLSPVQYLTAKFAVMSSLTAAQALGLYLIVRLVGSPVDGQHYWQIACLILCALTSTCLGLAVSSWAKTSIQAVLMVPVIIIPQILFSGMVFPASDWNDHSVPRIVSRFFPSFASQRVMDVSLLWEKEILNIFEMEDERLDLPLENLNTSLVPLAAWLNTDAEVSYVLDLPKMGRLPADSADGEVQEKLVRQWSADDFPSYQLGTEFIDHRPAVAGLTVLAGWSIVGLLLAYYPLARRRSG